MLAKVCYSVVFSMSSATHYQTDCEISQTFGVKCQRQYSTNFFFFDGSPVDCYLMSFIKNEVVCPFKRDCHRNSKTQAGSWTSLHVIVINMSQREQKTAVICRGNILYGHFIFTVLLKLILFFFWSPYRGYKEVMCMPLLSFSVFHTLVISSITFYLINSLTVVVFPNLKMSSFIALLHGKEILI